jgi:hypothetical protein
MRGHPDEREASERMETADLTQTDRRDDGKRSNLI